MRSHRGYSLRLAVLIGAFLSVMSGLTISQAATFKIPAGNVEALIAAINTANGNGEADTIKLAAGTYTLTEVNNITEGQNGLPSITSKITIKGVNANRTIIRRDINAPQFRILFISKSGHLVLKKITITGGFLEGQEADYQIGAVVFIAVVA